MIRLRHPIRAAFVAAAFFLVLCRPAVAGLTVRLVPARALLAPGEETRFSVEIAPRQGEAAALSWEVIPRRLGFIDRRGTFQAGDAAGRGIIRVVALSNGAEGAGHALVTVGNDGAPIDVTVDPRSAVLSPGGEILFAACAAGKGEEEVGEGTVTWGLVPKRLGSIGPDGLFQAGDLAGRGWISALFVAGERRAIGYATLRVGLSGGEAATLRISPAEATVEPGGEIAFHAVDASGETPPGIDWLAVPGRIGSIAGGRFLAGFEAMEGRVVASLPTGSTVARATARVRIRGGAPGSAVAVRPREAIVRPGDAIRFSLEAIGPGAVDGPIDWKVRPTGAGTIDPDGLFRAGEPIGEGNDRAQILATLHDRESGRAARATARVTIVPAALQAALHVRPRSADVLPGESVTFRAEGAPEGAAVAWNVFPTSVGTITPDGIFTANEVLGDPSSRELARREGVVVARAAAGDRSLRAAARVSIGGENLPASLVLEPPAWRGAVSPADLLSGKGIAFRARLVGPRVAVGPPVSWRIEPPGPLRADPPVGPRTHVLWNGALDGAAGGSRYAGRLIAELILSSGRRIGAAAPIEIRLRNAPLTIEIEPAAIDLPAGDDVTLQVRASFSTGAPVARSLLRITGTVSPPSLGTFRRGLLRFTASSAGEGRLTIRLRGKELPLEGEKVVPVRVRSIDAGRIGGE